MWWAWHHMAGAEQPANAQCRSRTSMTLRSAGGTTRADRPSRKRDPVGVDGERLGDGVAGQALAGEPGEPQPAGRSRPCGRGARPATGRRDPADRGHGRLAAQVGASPSRVMTMMWGRTPLWTGSPGGELAAEEDRERVVTQLGEVPVAVLAADRLAHRLQCHGQCQSGLGVQGPGQRPHPVIAVAGQEQLAALGLLGGAMVRDRDVNALGAQRRVVLARRPGRPSVPRTGRTWAR